MSSSSGSGLYKGGGYLPSFSNLSASAPPFKVEKSLPKANSTDPSTSFTKVPIYGSALDPAIPSWKSSTSSASGPKFGATEARGTDTTTARSPRYGFSSSQLSNSNSSIYHVSPNAVASYDPFSYEQFPNNMSANANEATKPYYPPYVSHSPQKDGYLGMGVATSPNFDLLSTSGSANLEGCGSSHLDHMQGIYGGDEYKPKRADFWTGVNDGEHGKWAEYAQGFSLKDIDLSGLSSYKSHLSVDRSNNSHPFVDGTNKIHPPGDGSDKGLSKPGDCFDVFSGAYGFGSLGIDQQKYKPSFDLNLGGMSTDCSKLPIFASPSASDAIPDLCEPVLESVSNSCGTRKANSSTLGEHFRQTGSFLAGCTFAASTSPTSVRKLPYCGSSTSAQSALSVTKANPMVGDAVDKSFTFTGSTASCQAAQIPTGLKSRSSVIIRRPPSSSAASSNPFGETVSKPDDKDTIDSTKSTPQVPNQFSSKGQEIDDAEALYSTETQSGGSDVLNLAEDSPCWKGASSTCFSPFVVPEAVVPDLLPKTLDGCSSPSSQDTQIKSFLVDASDSMHFSSRKVNESTSFNNPSVSTGTLKDHEDTGSMSQKSRCFNLNTGAEFHVLDICHAYTEDLNILSKTKLDSDSSLDIQQILKDGEASSARNLFEATGTGVNESCTPIASHKFSAVPPSSGNDFCSSPDGDKSCIKHCQSPWEVSDARIDINVLLNTMINLSEVFQCYCFSNPAAFREEHSEIVKNTINNLTVSLLMMAGSTPPSMKVSSKTEMVCNPEAAAATVKLCRRTKNLLESFPFKDVSNVLGLDNMTEAIKRILHKNFHEDEVDQQELLYKNLWLDAEAALCSLTAKTRFLQLKFEMEKTLATAKDTEMQANSDISAEVPGMSELAAKDKGLAVCDKEFPGCSASNQCDDIQASIMNKPHILNSFASLKSMEFEGPRFTRKDISFPSLHTNTLGTTRNDSDGSSSTIFANDDQSSVAARYQILKDRIDKADSTNYASKLSPSKENCLLDKGDSSIDTLVHGSGPNNHTSGVKSLHQIKCQVDRIDPQNCDAKPSSGGESNLPENAVSNPDKSFQDSLLLNSVGDSDDQKASVMARFSILQNRIDGSNSVDKDPAPGPVSRPSVKDVTQGSGWSQHECNVIKDIIGPFLDFTVHEDVREFGRCGNKEGASTQSCKANKMSSEIFEGWYGNDYPSSDWEHVSKEDLRRQD